MAKKLMLPEYREMDPNVVVAMLDQFKEDCMFLDSIAPELRKDYPDHFVAVYQKQVVATGKNLKNLFRLIDKSDVPRGRVAIEFVRSEPVSMIL
jgi:hypothetical protein